MTSKRAFLRTSIIVAVFALGLAACAGPLSRGSVVAVGQRESADTSMAADEAGTGTDSLASVPAGQSSGGGAARKVAAAGGGSLTRKSILIETLIVLAVTPVMLWLVF